jgi:hypothetical protein
MHQQVHIGRQSPHAGIPIQVRTYILQRRFVDDDAAPDEHHVLDALSFQTNRFLICLLYSTRKIIAHRRQIIIHIEIPQQAPIYPNPAMPCTPEPSLLPNA